MSRARRTFLWMAGLSLVTLALGLLREFMIARELRASGAADLFFTGLVVIGTARTFALALLRARWIPVDAAVPARALMRVYNRKGVFSNAADTLPELRAALDRRFRSVEITVVGCVALFVAREPR